MSSQSRQRSQNKIVVGLTGGIASGKNLVAKFLLSLGAYIIDADLISRDLTRPGMPLLERIVKAFGAEIVNSDGALNREKLGRLAFSSPENLEKLSKLTHPPIVNEIRKRITRSTAGVTVLMAPLLLEAGCKSLADEVWVVSLDRDRQVERLMARDHLNQRDAERRIDSQMSLKEKLARANIVIDNNGTPVETKLQVDAQWARLAGGGA